MQQYRVNYTLLIGLIVGTFLSSGAVYALWRFQIERKSGWLISEAEQASNEGDKRGAAEYYWRYLTIQSNDDIHLKYAQAYAELSDQDDVTIQELQKAWQVLEGITRDPSVSKRPEVNDLRRRLVKLYGSHRFRRYTDALDHLENLLLQDPKDKELLVLKASYLVRAGNHDKAIDFSYKLLGYDRQAETFDVDKAIAPDDTQIYTDLASLVRTRRDDPELADRIMDQLVEANPESAEAYLARSRYRTTLGNKDDGKADVEKAFQLQPDDPAVLLAKIVQLTEEKEYDQASELITKAKKQFPEDVHFFQAAGDIAVKKGDFAAALAEIDEGLKSIGREKGNMLLLAKADLQLQSNEMKGVVQSIEEMERLGFPSEFVDWYRARILLAEMNWFDAKEALNRLRPRIAEDPNVWWPLNLRDIDFFLGLSYERLGLKAEAFDQYQLVLDLDPKNEAAQAGLTRLAADINRDAGGQADEFSKAWEAEMKKPEEERDWARLERAMEEMAERQKVEPANLLVMKARLMLAREDYDGARKALKDADELAPNNVMIHQLVLQLTRFDPKAGPEKALSMWQQVANKFKDEQDAQPALRLEKADILIALNKDDLTAELASLLDGIDGWPVNHRIAMWSGMAARYLNLGMTDEARQYWTLAAEQQPGELPLRMQLFELALISNDDAGVKEAQDSILDVVKDRDDASWLYTEARRKLSLVRRGDLGKEALDEIRLLIDRAREQRRGWNELYLAEAELETLAGNAQLALSAYDEAAKLGRANAMAVANHINLLVNAGRYSDAAKQLERLPETLRQSLLGPMYTDILFRTNQVKDAIEKARLAAESDPNNIQNQFWYGQLLARSTLVPEVSEQQRNESLDKAIRAMHRVVELQPEFPDAWFFLINCYATQNNLDLAQKTLREAQLSLNGDNLQEFLAKSYGSLGRWFDAETMYRAVYEAAPQEIRRAQQLAAFYLSPGYQMADRQLKATPLINQMLRAGAEGKLVANDANLLWARRMAARMFAATGEYQNLLKAEKLLEANSQGGAMSIDDKLEMAQILHTRPEPGSRQKAIRLLEEVRDVQRLSEQAEIMLGNLYYLVGQWPTYYAQMEKTVARYPNSVAARDAFARKLLERGDPQSINLAVNQVERVRQLAPDSTGAFDLAVRVASKVGRQQQVRDLLLRKLPKIDPSKELDQRQEQTQLLFAGLLVELGDLDSAEKIYRDLSKLDAGKSYGLAMFLGTHRGVDQCFAQLKDIYQPDRIPQIVGVALAVVREKRDQVGDKYDADIKGWLDRGLLENPDSITLLMLQADFFDILKQYDDAAVVYRKLLARDDLTGQRRAFALNNLSYLLALEGKSAGSDADPLKLVEEAAQILGPNSDILDTRAVVYMARGDFQRAIDDLTLAVTDNPTASKYFHLAQAYLATRENRAALDAWKKAEELKLSPESINRMEHEKYDETKRQIEQLRSGTGGASVTRSEPGRRAG